MNLNPIPYLRNVGSALRGAPASKFNNSGGDIARVVRLSDPAGPWSDALGAFEPRKINPHLYEALREAIPILDGALGTLVTLDGILRVEGDNDKLVAEIEDWSASVPVNDAESGLQSLYESQSNERYEQGFSVAEYVTDKKATGIVGLRVADSKGVHFRRDASGLRVFYRPPGESIDSGAGLGNVEALLRGGVMNGTAIGDSQVLALGYKELQRERLLYTVHHPDADNPYGNSMLRSLEFGGKTLLVLQNALARVWERYGDPPLLVVYKCANRKVVDTAGELDRRRDQIARNLRELLEGKSRGNSADMVQALGKDDDFSIEVIGAEGSALEIEQPARHLLEQIVSKLGLPPWMLGLQFSTSERLAEQQAGMALQGAKTRFERRKHGLTQLVATELRLRGRTWKRGDWKLVQELPNIQDQLKAAQAGFLLAQTTMMGGDGGSATTATPRGIDNNLRASRGNPGHKHARKATDDDDDDRAAIGEPWAEDDPLLPQIEQRESNRLSVMWLALGAAVIAALRLRDTDASAGEDWRFEFDMLPGVLAAGDVFLASANGEVSPLFAATLGAWRRGLANAADDLDLPPGRIVSMADGVIAQLRANALSHVNTTYNRTFRNAVIGQLVAGVHDGLTAPAMAALLRAHFGNSRDWDLLVASEMAAAHSAAKEAQMAANGITQYDWTTASDDSVCPICTGHRDSGPHPIGAGPLPMRDSHPACRCAIVPVVPTAAMG